MRSQNILTNLRTGTTLLWLIALVVLGLLVQPALRTEAQEPFQEEEVIEPTAELTIELLDDEVPLRLDEILPLVMTRFTPSGAFPDRGQVRFRPTMSEAEYQAAKAAAAATDTIAVSGELQDLGVGAPFVSGLLEPSVVAPEPTPVNFEGIDQIEAGDFDPPPDLHGAVGLEYFCQVTNRWIRFYNKADSGEQPVNLSLHPLFAVRVVYDSIWNRWVIYAQMEWIPDGAMEQLIFIFVSETSDPTGEFFPYYANVNVENDDDIWDYGQVGIDQDAVIFTGNVFGPNWEFRGSRMFAVAKARLYNGLGAVVPVFSDLVGTLAPPIVLDQNGDSFLVAAPSQGDEITKYTLTNSSRPNRTQLTISTIPVDFYLVPSGADQPNTFATIETLDARFVNASTQVGDSLFQVHTVRDLTLPGPRAMLPTPRWYEFNTEDDTVIRSGTITASTTSSDWMASIAANSDEDVFVVWSSTEKFPAGGGLNAQVRFSGYQADDPEIGPGSALVTSDNFYYDFEWGRYSAVSVDPANSSCAWIVGEKIIDDRTWGTQIGQICFPSPP